MGIKLVREFHQKQQLALTPQLKKSIDLLQLSRLEIINKINAEIEENPFITKKSEEILFSDYDDADLIENLSEVVTLQSYLQNQLDDLGLDDLDRKIGIAIIQSLDENGLLSIDPKELQELMGYKVASDSIQNILSNVIQNLDPAGIGARNFKELVLLQLQRRGLKDTYIQIAKEVLYNPSFEDFEQAKCDLTSRFPIKEIEKTLAEIKNCDLSPGLDFESDYFIQPDIEILEINEKFEIGFVEENFPQLKLDTDLEKLTKEGPNNPKLQEKISEAKWLIRSVAKRNETVKQVGALICQKQIKFLSNKSIQLDCLSNADLAKQLKLSPSTISRILRSKYIQTPKGAISMKSLLSPSVSKTRKVTPLQLMEEIEIIISSNPYQLSDQKISEILNKRGFSLARRTISKYRMKCSIPNSRKR